MPAGQLCFALPFSLDALAAPDASVTGVAGALDATAGVVVTGLDADGSEDEQPASKTIGHKARIRIGWARRIPLLPGAGGDGKARGHPGGSGCEGSPGRKSAGEGVLSW
jgi:hypothetical protein